jgi:hypothetical protein
MTGPVIETPKGTIVQTPNGRAELTWNPNFQPKHQARFSKAQIFVDSEILRLVEPFTPLLTSMLIKSGILGTDVGSGTIKWIAPYAKARYFSKRPIGSQTGPLRGSFWFARMKEVHGKKIIAGAKKIAAGAEA